MNDWKSLNWYAVSLQDLDEERTVKILSDWGFQAVCLHREHFYKINGETTIIQKPLFPCIVIVATELDDDEFIRKIAVLQQHNYQIVLCKKVEGFEKETLCRLTDENGLVKSSTGCISDDLLHISNGPLAGLESEIKYIDRHSRMAKLQIFFLGEVLRVKVPLVITSKN